MIPTVECVWLSQLYQLKILVLELKIPSLPCGKQLEMNMNVK